MHISTFVFIYILFRTNILLLLLYPKHIIKQLGYNLGCYIVHSILGSKGANSPLPCLCIQVAETIQSPPVEFFIRENKENKVKIIVK